MNDLKESIEKSIKTSDLIGKRETLQQGLLAAKLNLDRYELNMQISRAHRPLKSEDNSNCQPLPSSLAGGTLMRLEENLFNYRLQESQKSLFHRCLQKN